MMMLEVVVGSFGSTSTYKVDLELMTILGTNLIGGYYFLS